MDAYVSDDDVMLQLQVDQSLSAEVSMSGESLAFGSDPIGFSVKLLDDSPIGADVSVSGESGLRIQSDAVDSGNGGGTLNYRDLRNKPEIEGVTLVGDKKLREFGMSTVSNVKILSLFK